MMASVSFSTWLLLARRELCDRPGEGEHDHRDGHRIFFAIFKVEIHVHFLKASADFQKTYSGHPGTKWRVVYMGNCTHFHLGTSFHSVIRTKLKVVPG